MGETAGLSIERMVWVITRGHTDGKTNSHVSNQVFALSSILLDDKHMLRDYDASIDGLCCKLAAPYSICNTQSMPLNV